MSQHKRIFIIGHTGAGKTVVAQALARKLDWQFIDADLGLEAHIGRTLTEILGEEGVKSFYENQSEILTYQLSKNNIVVATDANIASSENNRQLLATEFVVHLKVSTSVQLERTLQNIAPLLSVTDQKLFLNNLHHERDDLYEKTASFSVNTDNKALEEHVLNIINELNKTNSV